jgi:hypothetical protein
MRWVRALIALILFAGIVSWEVSFFSPCHDPNNTGQQSRNENRYDQTSNDCVSGEWVFFTLLTWPIRRVAEVDWKPEAVTATATIVLAFLTLVLAGATLFLYLATRSLVRGAEDTAERQLRAYVSVDKARVIGVNGSQQPKAHVVIKNYGQTPAYELLHWTGMEVETWPHPDNFDFVLGTLAKHTLGPGAFIHGYQDRFLKGPPRALTTEQHAGLRDKSMALYVFGEIRYKDAFRKTRFTKYKMMIGGPVGMDESGALVTCEEGNDAT